MKHLEDMKKLFSQYYKWNPLRIGFFGNMISSIIRSRSVNMQKVAENIEGEAKTEISRKYRIRLAAAGMPAAPWVGD